jgi:hypothetical protein
MNSETMREMMDEMMRDRPPSQGRRDRAERRDNERWRHHDRRDRTGYHGGYGMGPRGMTPGMMHGAGMHMMFAIIDADGDSMPAASMAAAARPVFARALMAPRSR